MDRIAHPPFQAANVYKTFNPDASLGWYTKNWLQLYAEAYGQLNTGPQLGPGYNVSTGLLFLLNEMALDVEVGHRMSGQLGGFRVYYGGGFSMMF